MSLLHVNVRRRAAETLQRLSTLEQRQVGTQHSLDALLSTLVQVGTSANSMVAGMARVVHETHQFEHSWQKSVIEQRMYYVNVWRSLCEHYALVYFIRHGCARTCPRHHRVLGVGKPRIP